MDADADAAIYLGVAHGHRAANGAAPCLPPIVETRPRAFATRHHRERDPRPGPRTTSSARRHTTPSSPVRSTTHPRRSQEALAAQREAEAELGDVTAQDEATELGDDCAAPTLLKATAMGSGDDSLLSKDASEADKKNQLDTLLNKASQYSEFIRSSQETAEQTFDAHAAKQSAAAGGAAAEDDETDEPAEGSGKRKKKGGGKSKKKKAKVCRRKVVERNRAGAVRRERLGHWAMDLLRF